MAFELALAAFLAPPHQKTNVCRRRTRWGPSLGVQGATWPQNARTNGGNDGEWTKGRKTGTTLDALHTV
eukprot:11217996-Lingulodinium_polyedra.AAC.1